MMTNRKIYLKDIKRVKSLRSSGNVSLSIITLLGFNRPSLADRGEREKNCQSSSAWKSPSLSFCRVFRKPDRHRPL